ncbi:MAG: flagellar hook-associated protein FlgK, partial [Lachnospiraceae bacterium]|nr:flagellar hook-associated protein FlgK [Lachnospiraceae bacterium]
MSSTFFGLSIGSSGLNAFHAAINTTANNISNVQTEGYSKQVTNLEASSALRVFQRYGTTGTGVTAKGVTQVRDLYYDEKYWNNQSKYGEYDKKLYYMDQIENYFTDSAAVEGFSRIYAKAFNALDTVSTNAGDTAVRNEFISDMTNLMTYFNTKGVQLQDLQSTINEEIKSTVDNVNSIIQKITSLNKQINVIELEGSHANELRDERAKLVDELSEIIPVEVREDKVINSNFEDMYTGATHYTVKLNG